MSNEMASYYVSVVPSLKGAAGTIRAEIEQIVGQPFRDAPKQMAPGMAQAMQQIGRQTQSVGGQISSIGSSLTKAITLPVVGAGVAVGGLVAALGWGRLKSIDSAQGQLRGLGYATEDVDRITQNLVGALEGGMLTMGQATSAAAGGLAAGVQEGAELTRYIQLLDAATAGSNGTFEEMNMIFARIQGAGKMMTGELSMIEQRMPGFSAAVAEHMGVSQGELAALVTAGEVTSEDFLDVMDSFGGQMAVEYAKTWEGMIQNTLAYIGILGEALLGGVFEQSKESIAEFIEFLASDEVATWAAATGAAIGEFFAQAVTAVRDAITWWTELDGSTQRLILGIAGIAVAAGPVLLVIGSIVTRIGQLIQAMGIIMGLPFVARVAGWGSLLAGLAIRATVAAFTGLATVLTGAVVSAMTAAAAATRGLNAAMRANPIGAIITALIGIGAALTWFFTQTETGQAIWSSLMDTLSSLWDTVGPMVESALQAIGGFLTDLVTRAQPAVEGFLGLMSGIGGVLAEMAGTAIEILSPLISFIVEQFAGSGQEAAGILAPAFQQILDAVSTLAPVFMEAFGQIAEAVLPIVQIVLNDLVPAFLSLYAEVSGLVVSLVSALVPAFLEIVNAVVPLVTLIASTLVPAFLDIIATVVPLVAMLIGSLMPVLATLITVIVGVVTVVISELVPVFAALIAALVPVVEMIITTLIPVLIDIITTATTVFLGLVELILPIIVAVIEILASLVAFIAEILVPVVTAILDVVTTVFNAIVPIIEGALGVVMGVINTVLGVLTGDWSRAWEGIKQIVSGVWDVIKGVVAGAWAILLSVLQAGLSILAAVWTAIWSRISGFLSSVWSSIVSAVRSAWSAVSSFVSSGLSTLSGIWSSIWSAIGSFLSSTWATIRNAVSTAINFVRSIIVSVLSGISSTWSSLWSSISSFLSSAWDTMKSVVSTAISNVKSTVSDGISAVVSTAAELPSRVLSALGNLGSYLKESGRALINGFKDGIVSAFGAVRDAVSGGLSRVRNLLPFSPAKEGPFSGKGYTLYSGQALMGDFGKGIENAAGGAIAAARGVTEQVAAEMASQIAIPDYLPASWSATSMPAVASVPSQDYEPAAASTSNASGGGGLTDEDRQLMRDFIATGGRPAKFSLNGREFLEATRGIRTT